MAGTGSRSERAGETHVKGLLAFVGMTVGSYVGWWLGDQVGFITACFASVIGTAAGLYAGRLAFQRYDDYLG
jgi:hypothetical protein